MTKRGLLTASMLLPAAMAFSAGYQINVQGVRQVAMGGVGCAMAWDASTIFYNPAGLSSLKSWQAYGSINLLLAQTRYVQLPTQGAIADSKLGVYTPFNVYVGGPLRSNDKIGLGIGVYTPFGSGLTWENNWVGRFVTQSISLQSVFVQPTVSYRLTDKISLGGGFIYAFGNVELKKAIPLQNQSGANGQATLKGNANGMGFNLGAQFKATEWLQFGVNYRSQVSMEVKDGKANFNVPTSLTSKFPSTSFKSTLPLPSITTIGVAVKATDELTVMADVNFNGWSAYENLEFDYADNTDALSDTKAARNYKNTVSYRLGANYEFNHRLSIMAGGAYDPSPVADGYVSPDLPDANHWILSGGLKVKLSEKTNLMAAFEYNTTEKRDGQYLPDNFGGRYQTKVLVPTLGLSVDF